MNGWGLTLVLWGYSGALWAFDYALTAVEIGDKSYGVFGHLEHFSSENGGFIANNAFIHTTEGVVVIDTGPSKQFGEQLRALIAQTTHDAPICCVYLTHHHPDHAFGSQAFSDVPIYALPTTIDQARAEFSAFNDNMYRLVGEAMRGTAPVIPTASVEVGIKAFGAHPLMFIPLTGHTQGDLAIYDTHTAILYVGNVFNGRAIATPQADLRAWISGLMQLTTLPLTSIFPAAGPVGDLHLLETNIAYLTWLDESLTTAAFEGKVVTELFDVPIPAPFDTWPVARDEYRRSLLHLFEDYERRALGVSRHD